MFKVKVTEHKRGWGIDSWINEYDTLQEALDFVVWNNKQNNKITTPNVYYTAEYLGEDSKQLTLKVAVEKLTKYLEDHPEFSECSVLTSEWYDSRIGRGGNKIIVVTSSNSSETVLYF